MEGWRKGGTEGGMLGGRVRLRDRRQAEEERREDGGRLLMIHRELKK